MKLLTKDLERRLPHLYANEEVADPLVIAKFFTPDANWTWYATEGSWVDEDGYYDTAKDKVDYLFFGLVDGQEAELGYFSLSELSQARGLHGLPVERDLYFDPAPLSEIRRLIGARS